MPRPHRPTASTRRRFASALTALAAWLAAFRRGEAADPAKDVEGHVIRGAIVLDRGAAAFTGATVNVYVENVTDLDARAQITAHLVINKVSGGGPKAAMIHFTLGEFSPAQDASYNVRVHIDVNADGRISRGDYISNTRYPVLDRKEAERLRIKVEPIR